MSLVSCVQSAAALTAESPLRDSARGVLWWIDIQGHRLLGHRPGGGDLRLMLPSKPGSCALQPTGPLWSGWKTGCGRWTRTPAPPSISARSRPTIPASG